MCRRLTESRECDETSDHEHRMQIELQFGIISPGEATAVVYDPEDGEDETANQQDCREDNHEDVLKPGSTAPRIFRFFFVASVREGGRERDISNLVNILGL